MLSILCLIYAWLIKACHIVTKDIFFAIISLERESLGHPFQQEILFKTEKELFLLNKIWEAVWTCTILHIVKFYFHISSANTTKGGISTLNKIYQNSLCKYLNIILFPDEF